MAKINNNPILKGVSGMLGDVIVFRERHGKTVMANRPKKRQTPTDQQKIAKARFIQAVQYAKGQIADPVTKAEYELAVSHKINSAYGVALADYLKGPEITDIDTSDYNGFKGEMININAVDNFKVTEVTVEIRSSTDALIEEGNATPNPANGLAWQYVVTKPNTSVGGTKITVKAKDKPNNITTKQIVLG